MYKHLLHIWKKLSLTKKSQLQVLRLLNDEFLVGVTGVIFNAEHEVLLVKHTYRRVPWSLPGGYLKGGEHPKKGLEREIHEETDFKVKVESLIKTQHDEETARLDMCYIGTFKEGEFKKSHEVIDYGFFPTSKLPPLLDDQYIQIELAYARYNKIHAFPFFKRFMGLFTSSKIKAPASK